MEKMINKKGAKIKTLPQVGIRVPRVGEVVYYPGEHPGLKEITKRFHLSFFKLDELRALLPKGVHIPTLREDYLIRAYASPFRRVEVYAKAFDGLITFYGKEVSPGKYKRAQFRIKPPGDDTCYEDLEPLSSEDHYVDTQLRGLKAASEKQFKTALEEQGLNPADYQFDEGVMATILERREKVDRIYVASGLHTLILHRRYGTPLVTAPEHDPFKRPRIDLRASGFPEELSSAILKLRCYGRSHFGIDGNENKRTLDFFMVGGDSFDFRFWPDPEQGGIKRVPTGLYMIRDS